MTHTELKKKYPKMWDEVYSNVMVDLQNQILEDLHKKFAIVAHNAAFTACFELYKCKK